MLVNWQFLGIRCRHSHVTTPTHDRHETNFSKFSCYFSHNLAFHAALKHCFPVCSSRRQCTWQTALRGLTGFQCCRDGRTRLNDAVGIKIFVWPKSGTPSLACHPEKAIIANNRKRKRLGDVCSFMLTFARLSHNGTHLRHNTRRESACVVKNGGCRSVNASILLYLYDSWAVVMTCANKLWRVYKNRQVASPGAVIFSIPWGRYWTIRGEKIERALNYKGGRKRLFD